MAVETPLDMFEYQLRELYWIENELVNVLDDLAGDTANDEMVEAFETHREETHEHVTRLETVFEALDREPERRPSATLEGLASDREDFVTKADSQELLDIHALGAALKTERIEITAYESLQLLATELDLGDEVTDALEANLDDEEKARTELKTLAGGSQIEAFIQKLL